ncbi:MAG: DUF2914 domain-containing protein [Thermoanaerobaculales bacterium]
MTKSLWICGLILLANAIPLAAQEGPSATLAVCKAIQDRACEGAGVKFPVTIGKLYAFSQATNVPDRLVHVWFHGDRELGRSATKSPVAKGSWRTWSNITVGPNLLGECRVEARDANGNVLATMKFTIEKSE